MVSIKWQSSTIAAFFLITTIHLITANPCVLRTFDDGYVCVCNATYCDTLNDDRSTGEVLIVSSSESGLRFDVHKTQFNIKDHHKNEPLLNDTEAEPTISQFFWTRPPTKATITVNSRKKYQTIIGFGGALTGSATHLIQQLPDTLQNFVFQSYYGDEGIRYNMMRIPIGGCDFDLAPWAYNEEPRNDVNLSSFTVLDQRDMERLSLLRKIPNLDNIKFLGSAWSPPPWMKTNNAWTGFGSLWPQYYRTWAEYHLQYVTLMNEQGIRFWAITTGNEPLNGVIGWVFVHFMSLGWTPHNQGIWVGDHLGPVFRNSDFKDIKIFGLDDQRYELPWWFDQMKAAHPKSLDYLDGFAVHWYWDKIVPPSLLDKTKEKYPDKLIINTESCLGDKPWQQHRPLLGSWSRAEEYITAYFEDFEHSVNSWIDWNLVLDESGGPNYTNNTVDAPIIVNIATKEIYKQPIFYAIGHFSKFIAANAVRIDVKSSNREVLAIGFVKESETTLVLYNQSKQTAELTIVDGDKTIHLNVPAKSIHSIVY